MINSNKPDFSAIMAEVVEKLMVTSGSFPKRRNGSSASKAATEWLFGTNGSLKIDLKKGTYFSHEDKKGGGVYDLVVAFEGKRRAYQWFVDNGFVQPDSRPEQKTSAPPAADDDSNCNPQSPFDISSDEPDKFAGFLDYAPVATFQYMNEDGTLAYEVLKFPTEAKQKYMQRRPAPGGKGWIWGLRELEYGQIHTGDWFKVKEDKQYKDQQTFLEASWVLYRADEVRAAIAKGEPIVLCEGEKDVETLRGWGFTATTNQGGAKNWKPDLDRDLAGAHVLICSDLDKAGNARTQLRGAGLQGHAKSVRVINLLTVWPEAPNKSDVTDWRDAAGGNAELFQTMAAEALPWAVDRSSLDYPFVMPWEMLSADDEQWVVEDLLPRTGLHLTYGPSSAKKTFALLDLAAHIATGSDWFGKPVRQGAVIYFTTEGSKGFYDRVAACRVGRKMPIRMPLAAITKTMPNLGAEKSEDFDKMIEQIRLQMTLLEGAPLRLIVIDTLARAAAGADENSAKDMSILVANATRLVAEFNCLVIIVHHTGNDKTNRMRGSSALYAAADSVWKMTRTNEVSIIEIDKMRDGPDDLSWSFRGQEIDIPQAGSETSLKKPRTSLFVVPETFPKQNGQTAQRTEKKLAPNYELALRAVKEAVNQFGETMPESDDLPRGCRGVRRSYVLEKCRQYHLGNDNDLKSQRNQGSACIRWLTTHYHTGHSGEWVWLVCDRNT